MQLALAQNDAIAVSDRLYRMQSTGCSKNLGHILTSDMSKTIKEITMHLKYSESFQSQVFHRMFKDVQCEHR